MLHLSYIYYIYIYICIYNIWQTSFEGRYIYIYTQTKVTHTYIHTYIYIYISCLYVQLSRRGLRLHSAKCLGVFGSRFGLNTFSLQLFYTILHLCLVCMFMYACIGIILSRQPVVTHSSDCVSLIFLPQNQTFVVFAVLLRCNFDVLILSYSPTNIAAELFLFFFLFCFCC